MQLIALTLNGERITETVSARTSLADFLREKADARSIHLGCEHGVCGACTIVIDGRIARSCIALAVAIDGAEIWTLEGLRNDPIIVELRRSFNEKHGLQCGYCTPGMLITARDIILRNEPFNDESLRTMLAGNICRCTGYAGILSAIQSAAVSIAALPQGSTA